MHERELTSVVGQWATTHGSRSTILAPLLWVLFLLVTGVTTAGLGKAPAWIPVCLAAAAGVVLVVILVFYTYFARKDPNALRSERFNVQLKALEKIRVGDNLTGEQVLDPEAPPRQLPASHRAKSEP